MVMHTIMSFCFQEKKQPYLSAQSLSCIQLFATPHTVAHEVPPFIGILQAKTLEWVAMPSFRISSQPGIKPRSHTLQVDSLPSEPPGKPLVVFIYLNNNSFIWAAKNCLYFKFSSMYFLEEATDFLTNLSDLYFISLTNYPERWSQSSQHRLNCLTPCLSKPPLTNLLST